MSVEEDGWIDGQIKCELLGLGCHLVERGETAQFSWPLVSYIMFVYFLVSSEGAPGAVGETLFSLLLLEHLQLSASVTTSTDMSTEQVVPIHKLKML